MIRQFILAALFISVLLSANAQLQHVSSGTIKRFENFSSKYIEARNVDVWLPDDYTAGKKYAVLYMQDGQMLFDSSVTWNRQEWGVDETMTSLLKEKKIKDCIVVAVWNISKSRHADYLPQKPFETLSKAEQDSIYFPAATNGPAIFNGNKVHSDNYLKFLVQELKPFVDSSFSTLRGQPNTFIAGSSMGGLISIYAICEYPDIFGGAGCLSTHWPGIFTLENNPVPTAFMRYLKLKLPNPETHKIYFDRGSETLDAMYPALQQQADELMKAKGFTAKNWITKIFTGEDHSEKAWNKRLYIPLLFLLGKQ
jgi:predicted alpha/beta superfamily hydrolase